MKIMVNGNEVNYELEGPPAAPIVLMSHSLAANLALFDAQVAVLGRDFRLLRYDTLGHGRTAVPPGPYTLEQLAGQALGLLDTLQIKKAHFLGISMGGMIGQVLALKRPQLLASLILCGASSRTSPEARPLWQERIKIAESEGMEPLVEPTIGRWFTPSFRQSHPETIERVRGWVRATSTSGYAACCRAIAALDLNEKIPAIKLPTLILVGADDPSMPVAVSRAIHERIPGSEFQEIPAAMHLCNLEQPEAFNVAVSSFLNRAK